MANIIQLRRDTEANWISVNPVLHDGEIGVALNCSALPSTKFKMGNGTSTWNELNYFNDLSDYVDDAEIYASNAANSAGLAAASQSAAAASAVAADNSANIAASFVGGNWPLPHVHVTGPNSVISDFSRASTGLLDGVEYGVNERRWNEKGTLFEPAVTNLVLASADSFSAAGSTVTVSGGQSDPYGGNAAYLVSDSDPGDNKAAILVSRAVSADTTSYTLSIKLKKADAALSLVSLNLTGGTAQNLDITIDLAVPAVSAGSITDIGNGYYLVQHTITNNGTNTYCSAYLFPSKWTSGGTTTGGVYALEPMFETGPTVHTYIPPGTTRAAESMTIPASVLNPSGFTVTMDVDIDKMRSAEDVAAGNGLFQWQDSTCGVILLFAGETVTLFIVDGSGAASISKSTTGVSGVVRVGVRMKSDSAQVFVDGVGGAVLSTPKSLAGLTADATLGKYSSYHACTFISNVQISNTYRTDVEMAYTGALLPDEFTTYYSNMKESANSRPYVIANGVAEEMLTEPGCRKTHQFIPAKLKLRAVVVDTNTIDFSYTLPNSMRGNPVFASAYAETTNWKINSIAGVQTTGFALALLNASANQLGFRATKTSHGLTDAVLEIVTDMGVTA